MNELQKFTSEISLNNGLTRDKNLYKLQSMLCPQIYEHKSVEEVKTELRRNLILFSNTSDEDFISLMKIAVRAFVKDCEEAKKVVFNGEYVIKHKRLLNWLRDEGIADLDELTEKIYEYVNARDWETDKKYHADKIFNGIVDHFTKPQREDAYMSHEWSFNDCCKSYDVFDMQKDNYELYEKHLQKSMFNGL